MLFAKRVLEICKMLPSSPECARIRGQLGGAGTSVGANYEEAQGAESKRDFTHKIGISYKEARESVYWLRVLIAVYPETKYQKKFNNFVNEAIELKKIFGSIKKTSSNTKQS